MREPAVDRVADKDVARVAAKGVVEAAVREEIVFVRTAVIRCPTGWVRPVTTRNAPSVVHP